MLKVLFMGGYAPYVWSAYVLVFVVLVGYVFVIKAAGVKTKKWLAQWFDNHDECC